MVERGEDVLAIILKVSEEGLCDVELWTRWYALGHLKLADIDECTLNVLRQLIWQADDWNRRASSDRELSGCERCD